MGGASNSYTTQSFSLPEVFIPPSWDEAADSIAYDSVTWPPPIVFTCGAGNSGKSTFSRHLLNTLLQRYKRVGYLDTDVGQPEFTAPGCLSFHVIDEQTPDLTVLCLKTPERCCFFGALCSKRDPKAYLNNIFSLYDYFLEKYHQSSEPDNPGKSMLPLVINTPGWVKGTGYDLLVEMLRYIAPTHVVQIRAECKNLPTGVFWLDGNQKEKVNLIEICAVRKDPCRSGLMQKDARLMRELRIISYFRQCLPSELNISTYKELAHSFASLLPYEVPISKIKVSSSEMFLSLKPTIVGLAVSCGVSNPSERCAPWCVGLGIVRAVDSSKDLLYVITPVPRCNLEKVDLFLEGFIETPACLLQKLEPPERDIKTSRMEKLFLGS